MRRVTWVLMSLTFLCILRSAYCGYADLYQLQQDKLTNYSKNIVPIVNNTTLTVSIRLNIIAIKDYDDVSGVLTSVWELHMMWIDEKFAWNLSDYNDEKMLTMPLSEIWFPSVFVLDTVSNFNLGFDLYSTRANILFTGEVKLTIGQIFKTACILDVTHYPVDEHICEIRLSTLQKEAVGSVSLSVIFDTSKMQHNPQWEIKNDNSETTELPGYTAHDWRFTLKRRPNFLAISVVFPVLFLGIINLFVFITPPETGERVSFSITVLLSHAVFLTIATDKLPDSGNNVPIFCVYLAVMLIYSGAIMLANIIILVVFNRKAFKDNESPLSRCPRIRCMCGPKQMVGCINDDRTSPEVNGNMPLEYNVGNNNDKCQSLRKRADTFCLILFTFTLLLAIAIFIVYI